MKRNAVAIRRLASGGAVLAAIGVMMTAITVKPEARADVDPYGANARFISLVKKGQCGTIGYTAEGYMVDNSGNKVPDSTWKNWDGNIRGCDGKAVFAWDPENALARIDFKVYVGSDVVVARNIPGNVNYCLRLNTDGSWDENFSSNGGGGSGDCTAS